MVLINILKMENRKTFSIFVAHSLKLLQKDSARLLHLLHVDQLFIKSISGN